MPGGKLKEQLKPVLEMRALLRLAEAHTRSTPYRVLNRTEKTVVWLFYEEIRPSAGDAPLLAGQIWVKPVRGYPKQARQLLARLQQMGCAPMAKDAYLLALEAAGKAPGGNGEAKAPREGSKVGRLLAFLTENPGSTLEQLVEASGYDAQNARTAIGILRSKKAIPIAYDRTAKTYSLPA